MKFKTYTGITWSRLELTSLLEDEDSFVCFERIKKHIGLYPFHLTNLNSALNEILSSNLNCYDPELKGFVLAYKNPKVLTPLGNILYDTCYIHVDIEVDFYIFRPTLGCSLKGIVKKMGLDHIGVLVHKAFNVSIPKYDNEENWPGDKVAMGQQIRFTIIHLDFTTKLPYIHGALNQEDYLRGCQLMENSDSTLNTSVDNNNENFKADIKTKIADINFNKNNQSTCFMSDSDSATEKIVKSEQTKCLEKKHTKRAKYNKKEYITSDDEAEKKDKNCVAKSKEIEKKSKNTRKTSVTVVAQDQKVNNTSDDQSEADTASRKQTKTKSKSINSPNFKKFKIEDEKSRKSSIQAETEKLSDEEASTGVSKVKSEKFATQSSCGEKNVDLGRSKEKIIAKQYNAKGDVLKIKSRTVNRMSTVRDSEEKEIFEKQIVTKKHSKKKNHLNRTDPDSDVKDMGELEHTSVKSRSKKLRISDSESDSAPINVKLEKSQTLNSTLNHNETDNVPGSPSKSPRKKHKRSATPVFYNDDADNASPSKKLPKKRTEESSVIDFEFEIPTVKIKTEKLSSSVENIRDVTNVRSNASVDASELRSASSSNNDTSDGGEKNKKKVKKNIKMSMEIPHAGSILQGIKIKVEKPDDLPIQTARENNQTIPTQAGSPRKKKMLNLDLDMEEAKGHVTKSEKEKKPKLSEKEAEMPNIKIKAEKFSSDDSAVEGRLNKSIVTPKLKSRSKSRITGHEENGEHTKSPNERTPKSKKSILRNSFENHRPFKVEEFPDC